MTAPDTRDWDVAVGRLVHAAALAEHSVSMMARVLSGLDPVSAPYLLPLDLEALIRTVRNLMPLRIHDRHLNDDVLEWTHRVRKLYAIRTAVVHTVWADPEGDDGEGRQPVWSNAGVAEYPVTVGELDRTTERLVALCGPPWESLLERIAEHEPRPGASAGQA